MYRFETEPFTFVDNVRCLECGEVYARPSGGGTVAKNPGCPVCGYVGWLEAGIPISPELERRRFAVGRLLHRRAQSG